MAKRTKKNAEPKIVEAIAIEAQEPDVAVVKSDAAESVDASAEALIDQEAEHRMQDESPAQPQDGEAEAEASAADTFEDAIELTRHREEAHHAARAGGVGGGGARGDGTGGRDGRGGGGAPPPRAPAKLGRA